MPFVDLMDEPPAFVTILASFDIDDQAVEHFVEDFPTLRDLMSSDRDTIIGVIFSQNKLFRNHAAARERCYITAIEQKNILALHYWTVYAVDDAHALYDATEAADFNQDWIRSIADEYLMKLPEETSQSTAFSVEVPKFLATNWFEVKTKFISLLHTRIGSSGLPLSYLVRTTRKSWDDTEDIKPLQSRRASTKFFEGVRFHRDNSELHRILLLTFAGTTLQDIVRSEINAAHGFNAWMKITQNVEGTGYYDELKRQADSSLTKAFFNPSRNFSFEQYFAIHTRAHEMMAAALTPTAEWKKIADFMKNIQCSHLQNDYCTIKDIPAYSASFTAFYNKLNENYRMLIQQEIIKPTSVGRKRSINQLSSTSQNGGRGRGGYDRRGRGRGGGRGRRGGRAGRGGRGGRGNNNNNDGVDLTCLPANFDVTRIGDNFPPDVWNNFTWQQRKTITTLRQMSQNNRQLTISMLQASINQYRPYQDDASSLGSARQISDINIPPPPSHQAPLPPPPSGSNPFPPNSSSQESASQAGSMFGRRR